MSMCLLVVGELNGETIGGAEEGLIASEPRPNQYGQLQTGRFFPIS